MELILNFIENNLAMITILVLATFVGIEIIAKVPTVLHTPLMSGSNAISGVVVIGAIIMILKADDADYITLVVGSLGIALAMVNVVGGFAVTNRMLEMFKKKKK
ncbi:NAD(P) transhydrogenase subunit alpha [Persicobacter psychrovividus]|uniref:proton-translocating NAD(P)(+) transhydrogenase n=1 Tax=Persicobacter psychrovividus TaxID=387638 RepID=A0ABM7VFS4_9BACT|nr:hypothetical protein PEPS_18020 [Persicobacter psychrovividus]